MAGEGIKLRGVVSQEEGEGDGRKRMRIVMVGRVRENHGDRTGGSVSGMD